MKKNTYARAVAVLAIAGAFSTAMVSVADAAPAAAAHRQHHHHFALGALLDHPTQSRMHSAIAPHATADAA